MEPDRIQPRASSQPAQEDRYLSTHERLSAPITGFIDYGPEEQYLFTSWLKRVVETFESFGFNPLHLRPFEPLAALQGEGEAHKQIFEIYRKDTGQTTGLGLPFDHTVPLALWVAEHAGHLQHLPFPYKRYDVGLSYRGERAKTGRFRAFVQADVDIVGRKLELSADVECMTALIKAFRNLNIGDFKVHLNHIAVVKSLLHKQRIAPVHHPAVLRAIDKLDKMSPDKVASEIQSIEGIALSAQEVEQLIDRFMKTSDLSEQFWEQDFGEEAKEGLSDLRNLLPLLRNAGLDPKGFFFAPGMVRGLAYYTGVIFETFLLGKESYGSIASGGRYSNLVGTFAEGLGDVEGVGGSLGLTRLFDICCKTGMPIPQRISHADVLIGARTAEMADLVHRIGEKIRSRGGKIDIYSGPPKIKQILSHANSLGIPFVVLIMDPEAIVVKDMASQKQEEFKTPEETLQYPGFHF